MVLINIRTPWSRTYRLFFLPLKNSTKLYSPLMTYKIRVYHRRICVYPWRISKKVKFSWFTTEDFVKNQSFTPKELHFFFALPLKKSSIFITYPWRIPLVHNRGDASIKCNSPLSFHFLLLINPLNPNIKIEILIYRPYTFSI